jgi:hypothetical protein
LASSPPFLALDHAVVVDPGRRGGVEGRLDELGQRAAVSVTTLATAVACSVVS